MKTLPFVTGSLLMLAAACAGSDSAKTSLTGTYADVYKKEFSQVYDTVEIKPLQGKDMYQVYTRTRIERRIDGKQMPSEYKAPPALMGNYDDEKKVIVIEGEPEYAVDLKANTLTKGNGVFKKIK